MKLDQNVMEDEQRGNTSVDDSHWYLQVLICGPFY